MSHELQVLFVEVKGEATLIMLVNVGDAGDVKDELRKFILQKEWATSGRTLGSITWHCGSELFHIDLRSCLALNVLYWLNVMFNIFDVSFDFLVTHGSLLPQWDEMSVERHPQNLMPSWINQNQRVMLRTFHKHTHNAASARWDWDLESHETFWLTGLNEDLQLVKTNL